MISLIIKILGDYVDLEGIKVDENTNFLLDLHLTSFDIVSMIGDLENDLGVEIPETKIKDLDTVGALAEYLEENIW